MSRELTKEFRDNAIDMMPGALAHGAIPELNAAFADAALSGDAAQKAHSRAQAEHARALDDKTLNQERAVAMGTERADAISRIAHGAGMIGKARQDALEKRKAGARTTTDMIIILNAHIARLDQDIARFNARIDALRERMEALHALEDLIQSGAFDPANQEHAALLDASGLDLDDIGDDDVLSVIDAENDATRSEIDRITGERDAARAERDHWNALVENADLTDPRLQPIIESLMAQGENIDYNNLTETQLDEIQAFVDENLIMSREKIDDYEDQLSENDDMVNGQDQESRIEHIDSFIMNADTQTIEELLLDPATDPMVISRIRLMNLKNEIDILDQFKGSEDYTAYLDMILSEVDAATLEALRNEPDLDPELAAHLIGSEAETVINESREASLGQTPEISANVMLQPGPI